MTNPEHLPAPPTLCQLISAAQSIGVDRCSLVREARDVRPAGVCVLMLGHPAIRALGPYLEGIAKTLPPGNSQDLLDVTHDTTIAQIFKAMDTMGDQWRWLHLKLPDGLGTLPTLVVLFLGPRVTPEFAAALTARGCPTSLT